MIDRRLFPFLETLAASGFDWLVADILAIVGEGNLQMESDAEMLAAQKRILSNEDFRSRDEAYSPSTISKQWSGDEQIKLATDIALTRIKQSLVMARSSIEVISTVTENGGHSNKWKPVELALVSDDGQLEYAVGIPAIDQALATMTDLHSAVGKWRSEMIGKGALE